MLLGLEQCAHLFLLCILLSVVLLGDVDFAGIEPVLQSVLLFGKLSFHLLEAHGVLVDGLSLLVDLLLEGASDLHHIIVVHIDLLSRPVRILYQVFKAERPFVQPNVQRCDIIGNLCFL